MPRPGVGSVYQRADGKWVAAVKVNGRKVVRYATSQRAARERLKELLAQAALGRLSAGPASRLTLAEWVAAWVAMVEPHRRPSTVRTYRQVLTPLLAELGPVRLSRLTPARLTLAFARLRRTMGSRRQQLAYATLHTCLAAAVRLGELPDNPLRKVSKPAHTPAARRWWAAAEYARFVRVAAASRRRYAPLLLLLATTGLRLSEALAITWADVRDGVVHVTKALTWAGGEAHLGPPKSVSGRRTVALPAVTVAALDSLPRPLGGGPVFCTRTGRPPGPGAVRNTLVALCHEANVPPVTVHGLRHAYASLLLHSGLSVPEVAAVLGHGSPGVTMAVYAHVMGAPGRRAAEAVERALSVPASTMPAAGGDVETIQRRLGHGGMLNGESGAARAEAPDDRRAEPAAPGHS